MQGNELCMMLAGYIDPVLADAAMPCPCAGPLIVLVGYLLGGNYDSRRRKKASRIDDVMSLPPASNSRQLGWRIEFPPKHGILIGRIMAALREAGAQVVRTEPHQGVAYFGSAWQAGSQGIKKLDIMELPVRVLIKTQTQQQPMTLIIRFDADFEYGGLLARRNKRFYNQFGEAFNQIASIIYQALRPYESSPIDTALLLTPKP